MSILSPIFIQLKLTEIQKNRHKTYVCAKGSDPAKVDAMH